MRTYYQMKHLDSMWRYQVFVVLSRDETVSPTAYVLQEEKGTLQVSLTSDSFVLSKFALVGSHVIATKNQLGQWRVYAPYVDR